MAEEKIAQTIPMFERVARDWCNHENPNRFGLDQVSAWEWMAHLREEYIDRTRLIIYWMREPTEAMILANSDAGGPDDEATKQDWRAMIDAALAEVS